MEGGWEEGRKVRRKKEEGKAGRGEEGEGGGHSTKVAGDNGETQPP